MPEAGREFLLPAFSQGTNRVKLRAELTHPCWHFAGKQHHHQPGASPELAARGMRGWKDTSLPPITPWQDWPEEAFFQGLKTEMPIWMEALGLHCAADHGRAQL